MSRTTPWRRQISDTSYWRQDQALHAQIFIISQSGPTAFVLSEEGQRKDLKAYLGDPHYCSCNDFLRNKTELCYHLHWLLLKKFRVAREDPLSWQLGLIEREVNDLVHGRQQQIRRVQAKVVSSDGPGDGNSGEGTANAQREVSKDDVCPICQEEFYSRREPITFCRFGCANSIHVKCLQVWIKHQPNTNAGDTESARVSCPYCRGDFGPLNLLSKEIQTAASLMTGIVVGCHACGMKTEKCESTKCLECHTKTPYYCANCIFTHSHVPKTTPKSLAETNTARLLDKDQTKLLLSQTKSIALKNSKSKYLTRGQQCLLCFKAFLAEEVLSKLANCKHCFHKDCFEKYLAEITVADRIARCPIDGIRLAAIAKAATAGGGDAMALGEFANNLDSLFVTNALTQQLNPPALPPMMPRATHKASTVSSSQTGRNTSGIDRLLLIHQNRAAELAKKQNSQKVFSNFVVGGSSAFSASSLHSADLDTSSEILGVQQVRHGRQGLPGGSGSTRPRLASVDRGNNVASMPTRGHAKPITRTTLRNRPMSQERPGRTIPPPAQNEMLSIVSTRFAAHRDK